MAKKLKIVSARCVRPATGMDAIVADILGGITSFLTSGAFSADTLKTLSQQFSGTDNFYMRLDKTRIFPAGASYKNLVSQQTAAINHQVALDKTVRIELWEWDSWSADDLMGAVHISPQRPVGNYQEVVTSVTEGSIYVVTYEITN